MTVGKERRGTSYLQWASISEPVKASSKEDASGRLMALYLRATRDLWRDRGSTWKRPPPTVRKVDDATANGRVDVARWMHF